MKTQHSKQWYIDNYRRLSAADYYIVGFEQDGEVYAVELLTIPPRFIVRERDKIRLKKFSKKDKQYLMNQGAYHLCSVDRLSGKGNKGMGLERVVKEIHGIEYKHDSVPFYQQGDLTIEDKQVQVKYDRGHMVSHSTLIRVIERGK